MRRNRKGRFGRVLRLLLGGCILLLGGAIASLALWFTIAYFGLRPIATAEYGEGLPDPSAFGSRAAGYADPSFRPEKGWNRVQLLLADGSERTVFLRVADTIAPHANGVERTISTMETLSPTDLIRDLSDADKVGVSFVEQPPFGTVGDWSVVIHLEDLSGNSSETAAMLHIRVTNDGVSIEAGEDAPPVSAFLMDDYTVESVSGLDAQTIRTPGTHTVSITIDGAVYESTLTVTDTVAPTGETKTLFAAPGTDVSPADFFEWMQDGSDVVASYVTEPDWTLRDFQSVALRLTDAAGNTADYTASLLLTEMQPVTVEATGNLITVEDCLPDGDTANAKLLTSFVMNRLGTFSVSVQIGEDVELAIVQVVDTTPPKLTVRNCTQYTNHPVSAESLCVAVWDATAVTVTSSKIDWSREGEQTVTLTATDAAGNTTDASFVLTLVRDAVPPSLFGVTDRSAYVGEPVAYYAEVFAEDALDGPVEAVVDASAVDANTPGVYPVTYTATDLSGNTVSATCRFTFVQASVSAEELHAVAKEIYDQLTTPDMTQTEILVALYDYVYEHITYTGRSDKSDWRKEAVNGIRQGVGDCFTFYATLRALLDETDIPYMSVTRKGGATRHYWLLVNVGTGWYHLDANNNANANWRCFMWTNAQCASPAGFWTYDTTKYPEVAAEPFITSAVIAAEKENRQ